MEQTIYDSKTCEDILNDCIISSMRKYADKEVDEETLYQDVKKHFLTELKFSWKRRGAEKLLFVENINVFDRGDTDS
ncbi:MAG: hypothetical protein J6U51_07020 [Bacteroidales bacterium]|nr:hypothetical protein [Bacteroidales bacterium]